MYIIETQIDNWPICLNCMSAITPIQQEDAEMIEGNLFHKGCSQYAKEKFLAWKLLEEDW